MLEIILLFFLCSRMGRLLRAKERKPLVMQILVVVVWMGSMFVGAMAYAFYVAITRGPEAVENMGMFAAYPSALLAGVVGQLFLFGIAWLVPSRVPAAMPSDPVPAGGPASAVPERPPYKPIG
jgi:hypothetical protein